MSKQQPDQCHVLIVDDNKDDREIYKHFLNRCTDRKYHFFDAELAADGLDLLSTNPIDCVLLDYQLPDLDGLEFLRICREKESNKFVPIVFLTGYGDESIAVKVMQNGVQDYMVKGRITRENLTRAIAAAIEKVSLQRQLEESRLELERSNQELAAFARVVSHDLQQPLCTVGGYLDLYLKACKEKAKGDGEQIIQEAEEEVEGMERLVTHLLESSRAAVDTRASQLVDCSELVGCLIKDLDSDLREASAEVIKGDLPIVFGESVQLGQIFENLIRFHLSKGAHRTVRIEIGAEHNSNMWLFSMRSNSTMINPEHVTRVLQLAEREDLQLRSRSDLLLGICKKNIEAHGGRIWAETSEERGAVFFFTLPI